MGSHALAPVGWWIATYAIHSTILLLLAWAITRTFVRAAEHRESVWRAALVGALLTATGQVLFGAPLFRTSLPVAPPAVAASASVPAETVGVGEVLPTLPTPGDVPEGPARPRGEHHAGAASSSLSPWWLLALWPLGLLALLGRRTGARRRLARWLEDRREIEDGPARRLLDDLEGEAGLARRVRLTSVPALSSPIALGPGRLEICLPTRAVEELAPPELEAMLAHEIAHLVRRDPSWLRVHRAITALFFFQPLNHLAVRHLHDTSEILCDAWAARRDDRRLALARCLARVADWILERPMRVPVPAMARRASLLGVRVRRLLDAAPRPESGTRRGRRLAGLLPVLLVAALAPGVTGATLPHAATEDASHGESDPAADLPGPFLALGRELRALERETAELESLLADAGHADLARRIESRLAALGARRDDLRRRFEHGGDR